MSFTAGLEIISTHSLTKRLTEMKRLADYILEFQLTASRRGWPIASATSLMDSPISTHSLTKRLTLPHLSEFAQPYYFNSQPHEEADCLLSYSWSKIYISTHSLTKRLTMHLLSEYNFILFQLTASRRGWQSSSACFLKIMLFQLTASRRGWRSCAIFFSLC